WLVASCCALPFMCACPLGAMRATAGAFDRKLMGRALNTYRLSTRHASKSGTVFKPKPRSRLRLRLPAIDFLRRRFRLFRVQHLAGIKDCTRPVGLDDLAAAVTLAAGNHRGAGTGSGGFGLDRCLARIHIDQQLRAPDNIFALCEDD